MLPTGTFVAGILVSSLIWASSGSKSGTQGEAARHPQTVEESVENWLRDQPAGLSAHTDVGMLNLACGLDLGGSAGKLRMEAALATLDEWARVIERETSRNYHRYVENPSEFGSEPAWKLAMMRTVLGQDLHVGYDPELSQEKAQTAPDSVFYADPSKVFLTGLLGKDRMGTCASIPVLYVALGQRLGYPLHLVSAKAHLFVRWDDGKGNRVNMEAANPGGFSSYPDEHYRTWPLPITPEEERTEGYLTNLDSVQALSVFLATRAVCLQVAGKQQEAARAAWQAYSLAPRLAGASICVARMLPPDVVRPLIRRPVMVSGPPDPVPGVPMPVANPVPVYRPSFNPPGLPTPFTPNQH